MPNMVREVLRDRLSSEWTGKGQTVDAIRAIVRKGYALSQLADPYVAITEHPPDLDPRLQQRIKRNWHIATILYPFASANGSVPKAACQSAQKPSQSPRAILHRNNLSA